jgi:hypothetical protein
VTLAPREQCIPRATFSTTLFSISKTKFVQKFKKALKSIDKIRIRFIIRIVGKSGEKWQTRYDRQDKRGNSGES